MKCPKSRTKKLIIIFARDTFFIYSFLHLRVDATIKRHGSSTGGGVCAAGIVFINKNLPPQINFLTLDFPQRLMEKFASLSAARKFSKHKVYSTFCLHPRQWLIALNIPPLLFPNGGSNDQIKFFLINNRIKAGSEHDSNRAVRTISQMYRLRGLLIWFRSLYSSETAAFYQWRTLSHPLTLSPDAAQHQRAPPFDTPKYIKWTLKKEDMKHDCSATPSRPKPRPMNKESAAVDNLPLFSCSCQWKTISGTACLGNNKK